MPTSKQNKRCWTNSCRISSSFIQIANFPCFFLSLSPPLLHPRGRHHLKSKGAGSERGRETNKQRESLSGKHGGVVTQLKRRGGGVGGTAALRVIMRGKLWPNLALLCLTDTRWQRFAAQLLSLAALIAYLLLTRSCSTIDPLGLCVRLYAYLAGLWRWGGVQDRIPMTPPPSVFMFSALSEAPAL